MFLSVPRRVSFLTSYAIIFFLSDICENTNRSRVVVLIETFGKGDAVKNTNYYNTRPPDSSFPSTRHTRRASAAALLSGASVQMKTLTNLCVSSKLKTLSFSTLSFIVSAQPANDLRLPGVCISPVSLLDSSLPSDHPFRSPWCNWEFVLVQVEDKTTYN